MPPTVFTERLLYSRHCSRPWGLSSLQSRWKSLSSWSLPSSQFQEETGGLLEGEEEGRSPVLGERRPATWWGAAGWRLPWWPEWGPGMPWIGFLP